MPILFNRTIPKNNCLAFQTSHNDFQSIKHTQFEFEIVYIKSGSGDIQYSDRKKNYNKGDLIILGPNTPHQYFCHSENHHSFSILFNHNLIATNFFDHELTQDIPDFLKRASSGLILRNRFQKDEFQIIDRIINSQNLEQALYLLLLLTKLMGQETIDSFNIKTDFHENKKNYNRMQKILNYINNHADRPLYIEEIASEFNMSRNHFSRFFNQNNAFSFNQYLLSVRIERACQLLLHSDKSITEIALEVGFGSISAFNRAFQQSKAISPSIFRNTSLN